MSVKIDNVLDQPKVFELILIVGEDSVLRQVEYELVNLAGLMSVGGNLNKSQVLFIAKQLIEIYPNESIADFKLCFERGAIGQYGDIQRMDGITLRNWMTMFLNEKYEAVENNHAKEKEAHKKAVMLPVESIASDERAMSWLEQWKQSIANIEVKQILPMTEEEIREEGRERPKKETYKNNLTREKFDINQKIHQAASEFYKDLLSFGTIQIFLVGEYEIFAESQQHAEQIYKIATTPNDTALDDDPPF